MEKWNKRQQYEVKHSQKESINMKSYFASRSRNFCTEPIPSICYYKRHFSPLRWNLPRVTACAATRLVR